MNMNEYGEYIKKAVEILPKGAFLTTADNGKVNTMTIGWGAFGFQWGIPTVEIMVRQSRFSKIALDKSMEFTLTFPYNNAMKFELGFCGQKSGRDTDKIKECGLSLAPSSKISTPAVSCQGLVFECKVIAKTEMTTSLTSTEVLNKWYTNGDLHTVYYAEILSCRKID